MVGYYIRQSDILTRLWSFDVQSLVCRNTVSHAPSLPNATILLYTVTQKVRPYCFVAHILKSSDCFVRCLAPTEQNKSVNKLTNMDVNFIGSQLIEIVQIDV